MGTPNHNITKYKDDILEQLMHSDCVPAMIRQLSDIANTLAQHISRAADEIERLRAENNKLRNVK